MFKNILTVLLIVLYVAAMFYASSLLHPLPRNRCTASEPGPFMHTPPPALCQENRK